MRKAAYFQTGLLCLFFLLGACQKTNTAAPLADNTQNLSPLFIGLNHILPSVLKESSGLCYTDGNLWSFGDGGNANAIYKIDSSTGAVLQTIMVENFPNVDWEDITADISYIYIGDFGNNNGNRTDLKVIRIKKSDLLQNGTFISLKGEAISFNYADQMDFTPVSNTDFDCESVISVGNALYLFTKDGVDLKTRCYKLSKQPGTYTISPISTFDTKGKVTAAAYNAEMGEIALLGYMNKKVESFIWFLDGYKNDDFFGGKMERLTIGNSTDWQTEGLDYFSANRLFMSCESSSSHPAALYYIQKN